MALKTSLAVVGSGGGSPDERVDRHGRQDHHDDRAEGGQGRTLAEEEHGPERDEDVPDEVVGTPHEARPTG